ncbi:unnamed protein product [Blepharisma stoltei]|uniref:Uncharacterized protein n=1 Tax=Blepharisma stoltei TaxID=1481888 RepID=A0AAU9JA70_9CILI|nr:unnamed protein product [Blepharisma stoltei]
MEENSENSMIQLRRVSSEAVTILTVNDMKSTFGYEEISVQLTSCRASMAKSQITEDSTQISALCDKNDPSSDRAQNSCRACYLF